MKFAYILFVTFYCTLSAFGEIYDRYDLAQLLYNSGISNITTVMCIIGRQSNYRTDYMYQAENGKRGYGIFQLYYPFWCDQDQNGNGCDIKCDKLLDNDLRDDIRCFKTLVREQGLAAFGGDYDKCATSDTIDNIPDWVWIIEQPSTESKRCPPRRDRIQ